MFPDDITYNTWWNARTGHDTTEEAIAEQLKDARNPADIALVIIEQLQAQMTANAKPLTVRILVEDSDMEGWFSDQNLADSGYASELPRANRFSQAVLMALKPHLNPERITVSSWEAEFEPPGIRASFKLIAPSSAT